MITHFQIKIMKIFLKRWAKLFAQPFYLYQQNSFRHYRGSPKKMGLTVTFKIVFLYSPVIHKRPKRSVKITKKLILLSFLSEQREVMQSHKSNTIVILAGRESDQ